MGRQRDERRTHAERHQKGQPQGPQYQVMSHDASTLLPTGEPAIAEIIGPHTCL
jgi:hypothetical protein